MFQERLAALHRDTRSSFSPPARSVSSRPAVATEVSNGTSGSRQSCRLLLVSAKFKMRALATSESLFSGYLYTNEISLKIQDSNQLYGWEISR